MVCTGNADELCGGPNRLNVFENSQITGPVVNPGPGAWGTMGCYRYEFLIIPLSGSCMRVQVDDSRKTDIDKQT